MIQGGPKQSCTTISTHLQRTQIESSPNMACLADARCLSTPSLPPFLSSFPPFLPSVLPSFLPSLFPSFLLSESVPISIHIQSSTSSCRCCQGSSAPPNLWHKCRTSAAQNRGIKKFLAKIMLHLFHSCRSGSSVIHSLQTKTFQHATANQTLRRGHGV